MKIYKINEYLSVNAQKYTTTQTDYNTENLMSDGKYHPQTKEELKKKSYRKLLKMKAINVT